MVKKKSFWLILLTVLTAVVLAFCACSLVGCSSESDDEGTKTEGDGGTGDQGTGDQGSGDTGSGSGDSGSGSGDTGSGSGSESGEGGGSGDGSFVLQGYYDAMGSPFWGEITFKADNTGYFATYQSDGSLYEFASGEITWEYGDEAETTIDVEMAIFSSVAEIPMTLAKVDGALVAGTGYITELRTDFIFYEESVVAALESKSDVGDSHAQVVLYEDMTSVVVVGGSSTAGTWAWTDDKDNVTITAGSTYSSTSAVANDKGQITQAVFGMFGSASDVTFLQMLDENLLSTTLYSLVSAEGYTLVLDEGGTYVTTVVNTYSGEYNPRSYVLTDGTDDSVKYTPEVGSDDDGNIQLTFATYYDNTTDVVFVLEGSIKSREDSENYQTYYNHATKGTAVAVFFGVKVDNSTGEEVAMDDNEYWIFLYCDGSFVAHVYDTTTYMMTSDGNWTWTTNDDNNLVPTFIRNPGASNEEKSCSTKNSDGLYTFTLNNYSTNSVENQYFRYTFDINDMPAGAFEGVCEETSSQWSGSTYDTCYLVLNGDGTFSAHLGQKYNSTGVWSKDEEGMQFYKTSGGSISALCEVSAYVDDNGDETELLEVKITNAFSETYVYVVDPAIVPVGGYTYTADDLAKIAELEEAAITPVLPVTLETTDTISPSMYSGMVVIEGMTITLGADGSANLVCDLTESYFPGGYTGWTWEIVGHTITVTIDYLGGEGTGTITYDENYNITQIVFTSLAGDEYPDGITFTAVTA